MQINFSSLFKRFLSGAYSLPVAISAVIAGLCLIAITEVSYQVQREAFDKLIVQGTARLELLNAFQRLTDAESGKRGYLLIHDPVYLEPFTQASVDVLSSLDKIDKLDIESNDAKLKAMQKNIRELTLDKLAEMKEVMRLHDEGNTERAVEIIRSGIGREIMQELRTSVASAMVYRNSLDFTRFARQYSTSGSKLLEVHGAQLVEMAVPSDAIIETLDIVKHV